MERRLEDRTSCLRYEKYKNLNVILRRDIIRGKEMLIFICTVFFATEDRWSLEGMKLIPS